MTASVTRHPAASEPDRVGPDQSPQHPRKTHRVGRAVVALFAFPTLVATGIGFLGKYGWLLDLASHFRAQYVVLMGVATVLAMLVRWRALAFVCLVAMLINLACVAPLYVSPGVEPSNAPPLHLLAFNLLTTNQQHDKTIQHIIKSKADLVLLQEVDPNWVKVIVRDAVGYRTIALHTRTDNFGIAMLVRQEAEQHLTIESARTIDITHGIVDVPAVEARVTWHGRPLALLGVHTLPPVSPNIAAQRNVQLQAVTAWVAQQDRLTVVCGDLNATPWCAPMRDLLERTGLVNSMQGFGLGPSWPARARLAGIPIDHCLHSPQLVTIDRRTADVPGSDHRALHVTLGWANDRDQNASEHP